MNKKILILIVGLVLVSGCVRLTELSGIISTKTEILYNISEAGVKYDLKILEEFENNKWVRVAVLLEDDSNLSCKGTVEECRPIYEKKKLHYLIEQEEVLSTLTEGDFKLIQKGTLTPAFDGYITKVGFEKLILNPNVMAIEADREVELTLDKSVPLINVDDCVTEKEEIFGSMKNYVVGKIGIVFKEDVSLDEAITLLNLYNLSINKNKFPKYVIITLPRGTEIEIICLLEKSELVKYGTLIHIGGLG